MTTSDDIDARDEALVGACELLTRNLHPTTDRGGIPTKQFRHGRLTIAAALVEGLMLYDVQVDGIGRVAVFRSTTTEFDVVELDEDSLDEWAPILRDLVMARRRRTVH